MSYLGPYNQALSFPHTYDFTDLRGALPKPKSSPGSIWDILCKTPKFSRFRYLVKLAMLDGIFDSPQANFTLFVPTDDSLKFLTDDFFATVDLFLARKIVKISYVERRLSSEVLRDSPISYIYTTSDPIDRISISNVNGETILNESSKVIAWDMPATNGIIHVLDGLIMPYMS
jgi:uncharacterized surface protein with fasciclin (FAS1) repeats